MGVVSDVGQMLLVIGIFVMTVGGIAYLGVRAKRTGISGAPAMDLLDDLYHPAGRRVQIEIQVQNERKAETPTPGDDE